MAPFADGEDCMSMIVVERRARRSERYEGCRASHQRAAVSAPQWAHPWRWRQTAHARVVGGRCKYDSIYSFLAGRRLAGELAPRNPHVPTDS